MAYRKLENGDHVKITGKFVDHSGRNAIVIDAGDVLTRVQVQPWSNIDQVATECVTIHNDHLRVRHEPNGWIIDGRIDHAKKADLERRVAENAYANEFEPDGYDEFDDYDRDDFSATIIGLRNDVSKLTDALYAKDNEILVLKMKLDGF